MNSGQAQLKSGDAGLTVASVTLGSSGSLPITDAGATQMVGGN